jgi:hypothetical protein
LGKAGTGIFLQTGLDGANQLDRAGEFGLNAQADLARDRSRPVATFPFSEGLTENDPLFRHGRARPGHPRLFLLRCSKDVDARHKAGHDERRY